MGLPIDHSALLSKHDFVIPPNSRLDQRERLLLLRYGRWLQALSSGDLQPVTPEQEHFVCVCQGSAAPSTEFERIWVKHSQEQAQAAKSDLQDSPCVGPLEVANRCEKLVLAKRAAAATQAEYEERREAVLAIVRSQLEAVDAEFSERLRAASEEVTRLEAEVKEIVCQFGESVKHEEIHAVYRRGRASWDSRGLDQYAETHPELQEFRKVGAPSVSVRYKASE